MRGELQSHQTSTEMIRPAPPEVKAGADIALKVKVSCSSACDLGGKTVKIIAEDAVVAKPIDLVTFDGAANETDEFVVKAPTKPGGYTWTAVFPTQEKEGILHEESSAPFSFIAKAHSTSMAVWDVPSPIEFNDKFTIKVGVKCAAECKLTDKKIEIYDHEGAKVAMGVLAGVPWPGTSALYWAEVELEAPGAEGYYTWRVKFPKPDVELPHKESSHDCGFTTARPPEHVVTVEVIDNDTKTPIENARVLLRPQSGAPYSGYADKDGVAKLEVPKGKYKLYVSKGGEYETFQTSVETTDDATIRAELLVREEEWWQ